MTLQATDGLHFPLPTHGEASPKQSEPRGEIYASTLSSYPPEMRQRIVNMLCRDLEDDAKTFIPRNNGAAHEKNQVYGDADD